jgi:hypothetical protein
MEAFIGEWALYVCGFPSVTNLRDRTLSAGDPSLNSRLYSFLNKCNRRSVFATDHGTFVSSDSYRWCLKRELSSGMKFGNKNKGTTKLAKGNNGSNLTQVWKTSESSQTRGRVFAQRFISWPCLFIHGACVMHESTNIHIEHHSTLKATVALLVQSPLVHKGTFSRISPQMWKPFQYYRHYVPEQVLSM